MIKKGLFFLICIFYFLRDPLFYNKKVIKIYFCNVLNYISLHDFLVRKNEHYIIRSVNGSSCESELFLNLSVHIIIKLKKINRKILRFISKSLIRCLRKVFEIITRRLVYLFLNRFYFLEWF